MKFDTLPPEFSGLSGRVSYVQRVNSTEFSSSCPQCGGSPHKGGDLPDRFRMWTNASGKNKVMGWCRRCSFVWFPEKEIALSPEEFEKWRNEQIEIETRRKEDAERAIKLLRSEEIWKKYNASMTNWGLDVIQSWGINKAGAMFWKLGFVEDYVVYPDQYHSPGISIPVWGFNGEVKNVKIRVLNPRSGKDRYRALYKTGKDELFVARPDLKTDECLLVEGEKKAMVSATALKDMQVVGTPSVTPSPATLGELDKFKRIYVCLDPDAKEKQKNGMSPLRRMIDILGKERVKVVDLIDKVDDMIVKYDFPLAEAIKYAK